MLYIHIHIHMYVTYIQIRIRAPPHFIGSERISMLTKTPHKDIEHTFLVLSVCVYCKTDRIITKKQKEIRNRQAIG